MDSLSRIRNMHEQNQARVVANHRQSSANKQKRSGANGHFWIGNDGNVWVEGDKGANIAGRADANTVNYWQSRGFVFNGDNRQAGGGGTPDANSGTGSGSGGGYATPVQTPPPLDQAQLASLQALLGGYDSERDQAKRRAALARDARVNEKKAELEEEKGKYETGKRTTLQDFGQAKTNTDINTRDTLENLMSSLSVMGLGGSRALTRQILGAANRSNRQANTTQAKGQQELDSAFNQYQSGYENDLKKVQDQYGYDVGEADRAWGKSRQNTLQKMADVYNVSEMTDQRTNLMREADGLNSLISKSAFMNPSYTGEKRAMATPELADYTQDIAQYNTGSVGADGGLTPMDGAGTAGNLAIKAVAVNDLDRGVKKKTEGDLGYGV